jgi:hypothetical protein
MKHHDDSDRSKPVGMMLLVLARGCTNGAKYRYDLSYCLDQFRQVFKVIANS